MKNERFNPLKAILDLPAEKKAELAGQTVAISVDQNYGVGLLATGNREQILQALDTDHPQVRFALYAMPCSSES